MTDKSKHTPVPWRYGKDGGSIVADSPVDGYKQTPEETEYYGGYVVCETVGPCNKPLIAAAPELLAACKEACEYYEMIKKATGVTHGVLVTLRAAIAKAEGK